MILALASVVNYDRQSDAPIWSVTSSGVNYDRNKFIIQATDHDKAIKVSFKKNQSPLHLFVVQWCRGIQ